MAWPRDAYVGQKVVCEVPPHDFEPQPHTLVGATYTVARVYVDRYDGVIMLDFEEFGIPERDYEGIWSTGFVATDYRPVQKRSTETGMTTLRSLLNPIPIRKHETAGGE